MRACSADLLNKQPAIQAQAAPSSRETAAQTGVPGASSTEGATGDRAGDAGAKAESAAVAEENFLDRVTASFDESDGEGSSRTVADAMADAYQCAFLSSEHIYSQYMLTVPCGWTGVGAAAWHESHGGLFLLESVHTPSMVRVLGPRAPRVCACCSQVL